MSIQKVNIEDIDSILEKMVNMVGQSKNEIFNIGEQSRQEFETITQEVKKTRQMVLQVIDEGDQLEIKARFARKRLSEVSTHFNTFSEKQVREAYEKAHSLQVDLQMNRQLEQELRLKRDDLERRIKGVQETVDRAEYLVSQISIVLNFLTSDLAQVGELLQDAKRHQEFGFKIIEAQEEERKRLSREMHDGPAQMMANVMMRSDLIERVFRDRGPDAAIREIKDLKEMVKAALYEVRRIIYDLRPMALDDLGLIPTLRKYLRNVEEYINVTKIEFISVRDACRLPSRLEVAVFRLVQESVQNAIKHSGAKKVTVKIDISKTNVVATIRDDGKGFNPYTMKEGSFGLLGMRERVELLDGELTIDSKPGMGTLIMFNIPITG